MVQLVWHSYVPSSERTPETETGTGAGTETEETGNPQTGKEKEWKKWKANRSKNKGVPSVGCALYFALVV